MFRSTRTSQWRKDVLPLNASPWCSKVAALSEPIRPEFTRLLRRPAGAIEIEGEHYWDGGLVSNTPLQWVVDAVPRRDTLAFQVDLWSAPGECPRNMFEVMTREKEIRYSSRTRAGTDQFKHLQKLRHALAGLLGKLPDDLKSSPEARLLGNAADRTVYNIVHLIYRAKSYEGHSKDYEFSRLSMEEHWRAGYRDARRTLRHSEVLERGRPAAREYLRLIFTEM